MPDLKIVLTHADAREERTVTTGTKAWELFADDPTVIAARVDGELRDLAYELARRRRGRGRGDRQHGRPRHPAALDRPRDGAGGAAAVAPTRSSGIGPPIENGFYYDFDVETPFVPEDLDKIETAMRKIIKEGQRFSRRAVSDDEARDELAGRALQARADRAQGSGCRARQPRVPTSRSAPAS